MLTGLDQLNDGHLSQLRKRLRDTRVGVLTHAPAVDRRGRSALQVLDDLGAPASVLLTPEHGFHGFAQAEEAVREGEVQGGPRTVSLYDGTRQSLTPSAEVLSSLDVLVVDLVDVGSRYYTYAWTALLAARAAREANVHVVILDRPNPIAGDPALVEGAPQQPGFLSFVGLEPLAVRHGLTLAEIVVHFLARDGAPLGPSGAVSVVPTRGWERHRTADAWGRPFVPPSPNMPTAQTALVYPGGCLVEGTNLSEGRGTTSPFQIVGAPFLDGPALARELLAVGVPGALVRPVTFRPTFEKHAGVACHGVMLHVTDPASFRPVATYLALVALARAQAPEAFAFRAEPYEMEAEIPAFDLLTGSAAARSALLEGAGPADVAALVAPVDPACRELVREAEARAVDARA
ncbi:MAG: DUF1343 domain-containing protein [Polyangiaceae bacterium]|nr:DUF1343 domain-containing protein [Polyangiaceae bacterium]